MKQQRKHVAIGKTNVNNLNCKLKRVSFSSGRVLRSKSTNTIRTRRRSVRTKVVNEYKRKLRLRNNIAPSSSSKSVLQKLKRNPRTSDINANERPPMVRRSLPEQIINFNELKLGDKIGNGGFGDVHVAEWKGRTVAVKKLRLLRVPRWKKKQFEDEVRNHAVLDHPNIVKFYGACLITPNLALIMEYLPDGSLHDNLHQLKLQFKEKVKNQFICDCFSALNYMHSMDMVHRDLKSRNVMLYDKKRRCKLADFDCVLKNENGNNESNERYNFAGTEKYCPKELLEGKRLTVEQLKSVDVYSMALTMFELLTGKEAFADCRNIRQIRDAIANDEVLKTLEKKECGISEAKKKLLKLALSSPQNRPSADDFLIRFKRIIAKK